MDSFNDNALSAYFPGLVDVCINDDGQLVYMVLKDGKLIVVQEYVTETESFSIPDKIHFQFTIPRAAEVMRYFTQDDDNLYNDLLSYLKRFSALDDEQWAIVAHYVFLTYLHDNPHIDYCGYILFYAVPERGKSRTGKSLTYVAFRGIHLVELREATIFRYSQNLHGTLFFDIQDVSKKAEHSGCGDILLTRAEKGGKCCRVMYPGEGPFNDTVYYDIYGPTIIASNEELHKILETRCLPIIMPNRPGNYENPRPELGLELKERLTAWRAKHLLASFADLEPIEGISGRLWDITKPMFFVNSLLPVDRQILEDSILSIAGEKDETRKDTLEGRLVAVIKEITDEDRLYRFVEWRIRTSDIRDRFNQGRTPDRHVSPQWIGKRLKSMSLRNRSVHGYSEIVMTPSEYAMLLKQYGYTTEKSLMPTNSLPEKDDGYQSVLREVGSGRECANVSFNHPEEREFYYEKIRELQKEGGRSQEQIELFAKEALKEWRKHDEAPF